ncbi:MAG TPA: phosphatase PAP2 family protein [Actinomycetospora sp.]|uniref:phosphatase PAP2 family protein n=1 Tax=Actinomycetospora sp. TaxID=1872135 RepID=UPI002F3F96EF
MVRTEPAVPDRAPDDLPPVVPTAAVTVLAALVTALLWVGVVANTLLAVLDPSVDGWIVAVRPPALVATAEVVTTVGQPAVMIAVLVAVAATAAWRSRSWEPLLLAAGALVVLGLLDNGVKAVVARPRPPAAWQAVTAHGLSFPSGHALWSAGALLLVVVLVGPIRGRGVITFVALAVVVAVTGSRLVLAVHYPSDVLAGWSLAVVADGLVLLLAAGVGRRRAPPVGRRGPAGSDM